MRKPIAVIAAAVLAAGCSGNHTDANRPATVDPPQPSASQPATPPQTPVPSGTVRNDTTSFLVRLASVKVAATFSADGRQAEKAKAGQQLIIVRIAIKNTGKAPSQIEWGNSNPLTLVDANGATYDTDTSWSDSADINPGLSSTQPYVFPTPAGTKPASVTVELTDADGNPSTVSLKLP